MATAAPEEPREKKGDAAPRWSSKFWRLSATPDAAAEARNERRFFLVVKSVSFSPAAVTIDL